MAFGTINFEKFKRSKIIGVDNLSRRKWVNESMSNSAIPIKSIQNRIKTAKKFGFKNIKFVGGDITNAKFVENLFKKYKFDIVIHCASQPSAPFANSSLHSATFTLKNNNISLLNILQSMKNLEKYKIN